MSPGNGTSLTTKFTVSAAEGWSDPDGDALTYAFGSYYFLDGLKKVTMFLPHSDYTFSMLLPAGK